MSIFHEFLMDSRPQNRPKMRPGMPPGHSWSASCAPLEQQKTSRTRFLMVSARFGIDLGWILEGFGHQNGSQNIQNLLLGFSRFILVLLGLSLPASSLQSASAGFAKRKQCARPCDQAGRQASKPRSRPAPAEPQL